MKNIMLPRIRTFSHHCREQYGTTIGKLAIDLGVICPNREKGGCIFCRSQSFTPEYLDNTDPIYSQIKMGKKQLQKNKFRQYFGYFQQETCTAADPELFFHVVNLLLHDPACVGLIISTRPDYVDMEILAPLSRRVKESGKDCLIELGIQTIHANSLQILNRNHSFEDSLNAINTIKRMESFDLGAHLIFGIPGESEADMVETVRTICALGISNLKLHHLQVIRGTPLAEHFNNGDVKLFDLEEYMEFLLTIIPYIPKTVTIHRLWATSHPTLLIAPRWNILTGELSQALIQRMEDRNIYQGDMVL